MIVGLVLTTLRLYRAQIVVTGTFLAALVVAVLVDSSTTSSIITEYGSGSCDPEGCGDLVVEVGQRYQVFGQLLPYLGLLPAAIGAFWGAPLMGREYETGTTKFAWTQSLSRRSWILTRLIVLGTLVALGAVVVGTAVGYWLSVFHGFDLPGTGVTDLSLDQIRGTAPVRWWMFSFAVGALSGALLWRTIPAIAVTVAVVMVALIGRNLWFGVSAQGQPLSAIAQLQQIEITALIIATVLLAVGTCWSVEHARV